MCGECNWPLEKPEKKEFSQPDTQKKEKKDEEKSKSSSTSRLWTDIPKII
ncbi:hypothetical protein BN1013_01863 [Candidatus Rubidus massiliensis]|nr:hypothetical protein BN1013_01863 [Candidatus Rubidus massiliensis]